jgi:cytochrome P450
MNPPPGSFGAPVVGEAFAFLKDPFAFTLSRTRQHSFFMDPENFTRQSGSPKFLQELLHPDAVPFLDGDRHKARRRLLMSAFKDDALDTYLPNIFAIVERFTKRWLGGEQTIAADLSQLGFDIADNLFGGSDPSVSNVTGAADFAAMNKGAFSPPVNLFFTDYGKAIRARDRLRVYLKRQVASQDSGALGVLKRARGANGEQLSAAELEIELLHFFFAAHGGLTAALAWLFVVLGEHPELAARLRAEADGILGDGPPTILEARKLVLARAVSREVLRAYPIAPITFFGVAKKPLELDGFAIEEGWKGAGAIWATLQDGGVFRDPTKFQSDRLGDDAVKKLPDNAFVPQGGGPFEGHRCPGETLIQLVMPAFLGWFTRRYDLKLPAQDTTPGGGGLGPLPKGNLRVAITAR